MFTLTEKEYIKVDQDGNEIDRQTTHRPSGPILTNVEWYEGKRWVLVQE